MGILYMVGTPIGNLDDITLSAYNTLKEVEVIACEDTRHTSNLLSHFDIKKRLIACHSYNEEESAKAIIALLDHGPNLEYCSDAGTPGVSDPGARLVERVRSESEHRIVPIPGASASVTLVSAAGRIGKAFLFEGFLSPKKGRRQKRLKELISRGDAFIIYESPFRILKTLEELKELDGVEKITVGRELTKAHEEIISGTPEEIYDSFKSRDSIKGEFALVVVPFGEKDDADNKED